MRVCVDNARRHELAARVDLDRACRGRCAGADGHDPAVCDDHVGICEFRTLAVEHGSATDHKRRRDLALIGGREGLGLRSRFRFGRLSGGVRRGAGREREAREQRCHGRFQFRHG